MSKSFFCLWIMHILSVFFVPVLCQSAAEDAAVMQELKNSLGSPSSLYWTDPDPCKWASVACSIDQRVTWIRIKGDNLTGVLPNNLFKLTSLEIFEVITKNLSGPIPSLAGLSSLQILILKENKFTYIPSNFFYGMSSLKEVYLDSNPFSTWSIPTSLKDAKSLRIFSATSTNLTGKIPDFFDGDTFPELTELRLSYNKLEGKLPASFSRSPIQFLWLDRQEGPSKLKGSLTVLQNMTRLLYCMLQSNHFSGPLPDFSGLVALQYFNIQDNKITGPVPESLINLPFLKIVNIANNLLQGPLPEFAPSVQVTNFNNSNRFCLPIPGAACSLLVSTMLSIAESVGFPGILARRWKGNDPCVNWDGIVCTNGSITVINLSIKRLRGTISPNFSKIPSLLWLTLSYNRLSGQKPIELTTLPNLKVLDVSNNKISGKVPTFGNNVRVLINGNPGIEK